MPREQKMWIFTPMQNARLNELIASLGGQNEIAPIDINAFGQRTGKLIADSKLLSRPRSASGRPSIRR
jgi:hypothetical protein